MVSFGEDYIIHLVKLTTLFFFAVINAVHIWVLDCGHLRVFSYLQVPVEARLNDVCTLMVSCGSFSMIRFCL